MVANAESVQEATLTLFAQRGYHGTSMKDIADLLNMRPSSLYNHMSSKQELLRGIVVPTMEDLLGTANKLHKSRDEPVTMLRRLIEAHVDYGLHHQSELNVTLREFVHLDEPDRSSVRRMRASYERVFRDVLSEGVKHGVFDVAEPKLTAYAILEMASSSALWFRASGPLSATDIVQQFSLFGLRIAGVDDEEVMP